MGKQDELISLIGLIYEAALDDGLWPVVLTTLTDMMGAAQIGVATLDFRAHTFESITPRTDPEFQESYRQYWAFHNPLWTLTTTRPVGEVYSLDSLVSRREFSTTAVFNEWFKPAEFGLAMLGANLRVEDHVSALICVANAPADDQITREQTLLFEAAVRHISRAARIHYQLRMLDLDLDHDTAPERLESLTRGVLLVDAGARVLFANAAARAVLNSGKGLMLKDGCLACTDGSDTVQGLIASCTSTLLAQNGPGGEFCVQGGRRQSGLRVMVTPLRAKGTVAQLPWLGLRIPVAIVTVSDTANTDMKMH